MPFTLAQKLKIRAPYTLRTVHAPAGFSEELGALPEGVTIADNADNYQQVHWFVRNKMQVDEEAESVVGMLNEQVTLWVYFPKRSSKMQTDLTRDRGWESLQKHKGLALLTLISFNDTWSAFSMRLQSEKEKSKADIPKQRAIFQFIDPASKQVFLPDDFALALNKAPQQKAFFEQLSFTNKKEYLEWVVSAKRDETRKARLSESLERLARGWKNPANR
jgi:hypothetical protein